MCDRGDKKMSMRGSIVRKPPNQNKHHFVVGWTGTSKRNGHKISGRINLLADTHGHAEYRVKEFYESDFTELEVYGTHQVYDSVA